MFTSSFSGVSVNDTAAAKKFYSDTLGLKLTSEEMGLDYDLPGGGRIFLYEKPDHQPAGYTYLNLITEDISASVKELESKGVTFERYDSMPAPQDELGVLRGKSVGMGPDIAWFKDPAGNILGLVEV